MKHFYLRSLFLCLLAMMGAKASAHDIEAKNDDGVTIYYKWINNKTEVQVTFRGNEYNSYAGDVVIPEFVTNNGRTYRVASIGERAFKDCSNLNSVTFPESVTSIVSFSFSNCTGLSSVTIPNNVTVIDSYAFSGCTNLTLVKLDSSTLVSKMRTSSNSFCSIFGSQVKEYVIGDSVKVIGYSAFEGCTGLVSVTIPNSVTFIGNSAFKNCIGLTSIAIPNSVVGIGSYAFDGTAWYDNQPEGLIYVGKVVYKYKGAMPNGSAIVLEKGIVSIADRAFDNCIGLTSLTIPYSVTSIGKEAFSGCSNLTLVKLESNALVSESRTYTSSLCSLFGSQVKEYVIGDSIKSIGKCAFFSSTNLTSVNIPNSVTDIGSYAFSGCTNLTLVKLDSSTLVSKMRTSSNSFCSIFGSQVKEYVIGDSVKVIGDSAFEDCTGLVSVTIPNSVTSIGNSAFKHCIGLTSIAIPNSVVGIGSYAFSGCIGLTAVTIPNSVTEIGYYAFYGCTGLTERVYNNTFFVYMPSSFSGEYELPNGIKKICEDAFSCCTGLTSVTIPHSVTYIGGGAFSDCSGLTSVTIPSSVTYIGGGAFSGCTDLNLVTLESDAITSENGGWNSSRMKDIFGDQVTKYVLGDSVKSIGAFAFFGCGRIESVTFGDNVTSIGQHAFDYYLDLWYLKEYRFLDVKFYVNAGTTSLLTLWNAGYDAYKVGTNNKHIRPSLMFNTTQTTFTCQLKDKMDGFTYKIVNNGVEQEEAFTVTGLCPDYSEYATLTILKDEVSYSQRFEVKTKDIAPSITIVSQTSSSLACKGTFIDGDATVTLQSLQIGGKTYDGNSGTLTGLDPNKSYQVSYTINVQYGNDFENNRYYTKTEDITTKELTLSTLQPKVISAGNVIVAAESNLDDAETNVGFEWRRTDWTDDFASNTGGAVLYEGTMEGYIRNLYTERLWKYRPYYESNSGQRYYGEWVGIDPTNISYFEPTVHTYAQVSVVDNTALVKGYAMRGTDNVAEQGFKYWKLSAQARGAVNSTEVPADAVTVKANGQVMTAQLTDLDYETDYCYVAFVTTNEGETFYGEQQSFKTGINTSGVHDATIKADVTEVARYDLRGRRIDSPQKGMNIVLMSDGSTHKVYVK